MSYNEIVAIKLKSSTYGSYMHSFLLTDKHSSRNCMHVATRLKNVGP